MDSNITTAIIGVGGALFGTLIGGLITWKITKEQLKSEENRERRERKIQKLEELHKLLSVIKQEAMNIHMDIIGWLSHNSEPSVAQGERIPLDKLVMLINFYADDLKENLDIITENWQKLGSTLGTAILGKNKNSETLILSSQSYAQSIGSEVKKAQKKLSDSINKTFDTLI